MKVKQENFIKDKTNFFLKDTNIENLFINEYMPQAKGDYVKVYLFALMYADADEPMDNEMIARHLGREVEEILAAWTYWEKAGIIRKHYRSPDSKLDYAVEFINLRQRLLQSSMHPALQDEDIIEKGLKDTLCNEKIKSMYASIEKITGRTLEARELTDILSWVEEDSLSPDLIIKTYLYCVERKGNNKYKYVASLIKTWKESDILTPEQMESYLSENDQRQYMYKRVLKALGFHRFPTEEEKKLMDGWFDDLQFGLETVLDACKKTSGISNPNIRYVNSILKNWKEEKNSGRGESPANSGGDKVRKKNSVGAVLKSYEAVREKNKDIYQKRREEVYGRVPRIKEIEGLMADYGLKISKLMLSKKANKELEIDMLRKEADKLSGEKAYLLTDNGFAYDYLEPVYECKLCKDTGMLDTGDRCSCFAQKLKTGGQ